MSFAFYKKQESLRAIWIENGKLQYQQREKNQVYGLVESNTPDLFIFAGYPSVYPCPTALNRLFYKQP